MKLEFMNKANNILKRFKEIEENYPSINELAKSSKYLIFVDRHYSGLNTELKNLGYDSEIVPEFIEYPRAERDYQTHIWLNSKRKKIKDKPIIFITRNYSDFTNFTPKRYTIFSVVGNYFTDKLVNKVVDFLRTKSLDSDKVYPIKS